MIEFLSSPGFACSSILRRRHAEHVLEVPAKVTLIGETAFGRYFGRRLAGPGQVASPRYPHT